MLYIKVSIVKSVSYFITLPTYQYTVYFWCAVHVYLSGFHGHCMQSVLELTVDIEIVIYEFSFSHI